MRTILVIVMLTFISSAQEQITDFSQLMNNLKKGKTVKVVIDYSKCLLVVDGKDTIATKDTPRAMGGMEFRTWEYFDTMVVKNKNAFVSTSESILINHSRYGYITNYARLKIFDNNKAEILIRYLDNYREVVDETFYTIINDKKNNSGLFLFAY
ncbi:MAG TPA: hypothetical protein PLI27_03250 [Ignavibacteriales bacterium]|nr:hypothetical protein [Ignavibacteriales bacterium]HOM65816.1 hypothetical protein [Ignavibacteriales bacterium]HPD67081.1 hypothetical protein [Ignavibacteriales bacterium]HPP33946.1 hypothetical protein [Ignavibacteriales bacterium]HRR18995.1 hypothetical protein [Ignavibacteriales bacterium]